MGRESTEGEELGASSSFQGVTLRNISEWSVLNRSSKGGEEVEIGGGN